MNIGGLKTKLINKADLIAFIASAYERYPDINRLFEHYTNFGEGGFLWQAGATLSDIHLLRYKLWESSHLYTTLFKGGLIAYLATELGFIDKKWRKTLEKVLLGSGAAALTLGGSGPTSNSYGSSGGSRGWGRDN